MALKQICHYNKEEYYHNLAESNQYNNGCIDIDINIIKNKLNSKCYILDDIEIRQNPHLNGNNIDKEITNDNTNHSQNFRSKIFLFLFCVVLSVVAIVLILVEI